MLRKCGAGLPGPKQRVHRAQVVQVALFPDTVGDVRKGPASVGS